MRIPTNELHTLRDWVRWSASRFAQSNLYFGHGTDNALDEALELVLATLHLQHDMAESLLDACVTRAEADLLGTRIAQRVEQRIPLPYLTGRAYFAGLVFSVNEHVLIPRSPIAELIENGFSPWLDQAAPKRILDLCTGSGCIGIACAHAFPQAQVDLLDISPQALEVAQQNIALHGLQDRVSALASDVFDGVPDQQYDLIVSNPPYVCEAEMQTLPDEYRHEPRLALAAGDDGMDIVSRILAQARDYMTPDAILVIEVGASAGLLQARYPDAPFLWLDFARGGEGVFLLRVEQLNEPSLKNPVFQ